MGKSAVQSRWPNSEKVTRTQVKLAGWWGQRVGVVTGIGMVTEGEAALGKSPL